MDDEREEPTDEGGPDAGPGQVPPIIRAGCYALTALGLMSLLLSLPSLFDAGGVRCTIARSIIEDANGDDAEFNDVDTGGEEPGDLSCDRAEPLAEAIPLEEGEPETHSVPSEGAIRARGGLSLVVSSGQAAAGLFTLRTLARGARTAALVFAAAGIVVPVLGLVTVAVLVFVVYALAFGQASREVWPRAERRPRS